MSSTNNNERVPARRGFGAMSPEKRRAIARQGGIAAHRKGAAHHFNSDEAKAAGKKGGDSVSKNREHMASIGRKGGIERAARRAERGTAPVFHVRQAETGWLVLDASEAELAPPFATSAEALAHAEELARGTGAAHVRVYDANGTIETELFVRAA